MRRVRWLILASFALLPSTVAMAHPEGFSGMHVRLGTDRITVALTVHTRDMGAWYPPTKYLDYVADVTSEMETSAAEIVELHLDGQAQPIDRVHAFLLEVGLIEIDIDYKLPAFTSPAELLVWSKHLIHLPRNHQQLLFVEDRRAVATEVDQGVILLDDVLSVERDAAVVTVEPMAEEAASANPDSLAEPLGWQDDFEDSEPVRNLKQERQPKIAERGDGPKSRISFFLFGVEHIITGYDHLLFLAALLLACATYSEAATIVTCFTVAHSITLAMAALDVVYLPSEVVEPIIALSIVYVALENLFDSGKSLLWRRALVTCAFGLVHGLGFASALRDIGLRNVPGGVLWPLLKFNLGVEAGQLSVAAVVLPLLFYAKRSKRASKAVLRVGSVIVACVGTYWLTIRLFSF
jgi:hydrogenase/urease accessory protein HupE